ncbi:MAG: DNA helicase RecQ [Eubacteriales bacterium]|nr:DNA helicase RecQ [Eubacteriales bacterium]
MDLKERLLREAFGYTAFRPGQRKLIDAMLSGKDVLGVMPTGAGKSICYQLSAMLLPGVTLVISPLISLMQDQTAALQRAGISVCLINSAQTPQERRASMHLAASGRCKMIYIAPERLATPDFCDLIQRLPISMVAVDEAHCISQWGHDFRPSYRKIPQFLQSLPSRPIVSAFTATATARVREDIVQALGLQQPERLVTSFDRPNLYYEVRRVYDREAQLLRFIQKQGDVSGIVYCLTRKKTEEMAQYLRDHAIRAAVYHAGMDTMARRLAQQRFVGGEIPVMVATNAFGMGIDKPDVRFVVHFGMPRDMESYYQEAGRAGRDGMAARCLLLFDENDIQFHTFLIRQDPENPCLTEEEVDWLRDNNLARLRDMKRYVFTEGCLRQQILQYFGQEAPDFCGQCGNCEAASVEQDITTAAQKLLSCVYRVREQCDADMLCRIVLGKNDPDIVQAGYTTLSTFGIMKDSAHADIMAILQHLVSLGYLIRQDNPSPRLCLSASAKPVLFEGETVSMRVQVSPQQARLARESSASEHPQLAKALREYRQRLAKLRGVPAFAVCSDRTLEELVKQRPQDEEQLTAILGKRDAWKTRELRRMLEIIGKWTEC